MNNNEHDDFEGLTFDLEEFAMRFAPQEGDEETPSKHSLVYAYSTTNDCHGIVFADSMSEAVDKIHAHYGSDDFDIELIEIDPDQDIIEIM